MCHMPWGASAAGCATNRVSSGGVSGWGRPPRGIMLILIGHPIVVGGITTGGGRCIGSCTAPSVGCV